MNIQCVRFRVNSLANYTSTKKIYSTVFLVLFFFFVSLKVSGQTSFSPSLVRPVLEEQQRKAFTYFTDYVDPVSGLAFEGDQRGYDVITIGGSGFGVMALIVGVERGWITRDAASQQIANMVKFLGTADRIHGVWPHWVNTDGTAAQFGSSQVKAGDLVEASFMVAGLLAARQYFNDVANPAETAIRDSINSFWNTIEWSFYTNNQDVLYWAYDEGRPADGDARFVLQLRGWNEGLITYLMALAAPPAHAISQDIYTKGWLDNMFSPNNIQYGYPYVLDNGKGGPLFLSQYSFLGLDPRRMKDTGSFYWKDQVAQVMINREYCLSDANPAFAYDEENWGLTACYGVDAVREYLARSPSEDDGIISPTAALSSMPYTPYYSLQVLLNLAQDPSKQTAFGLVDSYAPASGLKAARNLAIDQGPIVVMIENYRSGLIWNLLMQCPEIQSGLSLAGINEPTFNTGFPLVTSNTQTGVYDMVQHVDREVYELPFYVQQAEQALFQFKNTSGQVVRKFFVKTVPGSNVFSFKPDCNIVTGQHYTIEMAADGMINSLPVILR